MSILVVETIAFVIAFERMKNKNTIRGKLKRIRNTLYKDSHSRKGRSKSFGPLINEVCI